MGYHPAWKFREVHELVFTQGRLIAAADRSTQMAELRDQLKNKPPGPGHRDGCAAIQQWVEKCFSLDD